MRYQDPPCLELPVAIGDGAFVLPPALRPGWLASLRPGGPVCLRDLLRHDLMP